MKKSSILFLLALFVFNGIFAQPPADFHKMSRHLVEIFRQHQTSRHHRSPQSSRPFVSVLMTLTKGNMQQVAQQYGLEVIDSIGRIYIVDVAYSVLGNLSKDHRVERIEAEPMVRQAMDVTPGQVNATAVHSGESLPQAFTGEGVAAGIFDNGYDFTHPAFLNADGQLRARYYYDFCWQNEDGTKGHAMSTTEEIAAYGGTHYPNASLHGTHVMGIMAGRAVDGKYSGMAPDADIYAVHFNSYPEDFETSDQQTSANCVLGFKYIFDQAEKDGKPCVVNFSNGESYTFDNQRLLESEALQSLTGPGRIIVVCAGNDGNRTSYLEKPVGVRHAGAGMVNGVGGGDIIDMDIVTPGNQNVRLDFLGLRLMGLTIDNTINFRTDSVLELSGDTCSLATTTQLGDVSLKVWKSDFKDERGDVFHVHAQLPTPVYMVLCGALFLLTSDSPAWVYSDIKYCPFVNLTGADAYTFAQPGHSIWWPGTLPGLITVGATGYKSSFRNIDGNMNTDLDEFAAKEKGQIALFSSKGPTYEGQTKPDVTAPGMSINAAFNSYVTVTEQLRKQLTDKVDCNGKTYYYTAQSGTSMASPVVAGAIALWLQANPDLTIEQIKDVFAHTCTHPEQNMDYPNNTYGYGQIDVYKGLLYILDLPNSIPELSQQQPAEARFSLQGRRLSVHFTNAAPIIDSPASLSVYTTDGRKMRSILLDGDMSADLSALPAGLYAIQLTTDHRSTTGSTLLRLK